MKIERNYLIGAFNFASSIVLAYALALWMNWDMPKYSALAVVLISLDSTKASLQKGVLRILGTIVGVLVAFIFLSAFAQERFELMMVQAVYLFIISYFMQLSKYWYAWYVAGFVPFVAWSYSYANEAYAFYYGAYRFLETITGIFIFSVMSLIFLSDNDREESDSQSVDPSIDKRISWDKLKKSVFVTVTYIVAFIFWVYVDPPEKAHFLGILVPLALINLEIDIDMLKLLFLFFIAVWLLVAPFYFILMPSLTSGFELFVALYIYSFIFGYLGFISPVLKLPTMIVLVMTTGISNAQQYSFEGFANGSLTLFLALSIIAIMKLIIFDGKKFKTVFN